MLKTNSAKMNIGALIAQTLGGVGSCSSLLEEVEIECSPLGVPTAMVPAESLTNASWIMVCYYGVHHCIRKYGVPGQCVITDAASSKVSLYSY